MKVSAYLDTVVRLDGAVGFIVAPHPEYNIWCVKWPDEGDPRWASPDLIRAWLPGTGIEREQLLIARGKLIEELEMQALRDEPYHPLNYIH